MLGIDTITHLLLVIVVVFVREFVNGASVATTQATLATDVSGTDRPSWNSWGDWAACSVSCGGGIRKRNRECSTGNDRDCVTLFSHSSQAETCNDVGCPLTPVADDNFVPTTEKSFPDESGGGKSYRIVGGKAASTCERFPWMVLVYNKLLQKICGGTIIGRQHVLTAAHCIDGNAEVPVAPSKLNILSGSTEMPFGIVVTGVTWSTVEKLYRHESYNRSTLRHDVAVIKLTRPFPENNCHREIRLTDGSKTPQQATDCLAMGWGLDANGGQVQSTLQWVEQTVTTDNQCRRRFGVSATDTAFCAVGDNAGVCQGDSGGSLACKEADGQYVQYGLVTGVVDQKCGILEGFFTKVDIYLPWINDKMSQ